MTCAVFEEMGEQNMIAHRVYVLLFPYGSYLPSLSKSCPLQGADDLLLASCFKLGQRRRN